MHSLRHTAATLLIAVVALGGVATPLVHEAAHSAARTATVASHAADGHHDGPASEGGTHVSDACPTLTPPADLACTLCQGLTVGLRAPAASVVDATLVDRTWAPVSQHVADAYRAAESSRGPPAA